MFTLDQARSFIAVAEELHFGRAAERLHMTQPPLSRQIQILEGALDIRLLDRSSRFVRLTPAGRVFYAEARRLLQLAEGAASTARRVARGDAGLVRLGFTAASSYSFLPRLVSFARKELPDVSLALREMVTSEQLDELTSHRLDLGLVRPPIDVPGVESVCVAREVLLLAVPTGHPLGEGAEPTLKDLHQQPLITYSPTEGRYFHGLIDGLFRAAGVSPSHSQYLSQTHSILALVGAGLGVALVPSAALSLHIQGVVVRPIRLPHPTSVELLLVWHRDNDNPAVNTLRQCVLRHFPSDE